MYSKPTLTASALALTLSLSTVSAQARDLIIKKERGRVPALDSQDAWERRMAEGAAAFMRYKKEGRYE